MHMYAVGAKCNSTRKSSRSKHTHLIVSCKIPCVGGSSE